MLCYYTKSLVASEIVISISINISERKSGTKRTEKWERTPARDEIQTKAISSTFSPPECGTGVAIHCVDTIRI